MYDSGQMNDKMENLLVTHFVPIKNFFRQITILLMYSMLGGNIYIHIEN